MDKVKKLVRYISKYGKCTKQFAAKYLLTIFRKNDFFALPDEKQQIIIDNLICYFDTLIISCDNFGNINNKQQNHNITKIEIFKHIENKVFDLVQIKQHLKKF